TDGEESELGSNPLDPNSPLVGGGNDLDGDGTPNGGDLDYKPGADSDEDGVTDGVEYANGSCS
ncbi:MAG: hypothetical protein JKY50_07045, partial [Oleispira sp.]|nr:hypothetical protein [Oleispira sp.]